MKNERGHDMLGSKIKELRKQHHINQDRFAETIGVSRATLSRWERNEAVPDSEQLTRIANSLQINIAYLLDDELSEKDINKDCVEYGNDEIVKQLIRINDNFAEEISRRKDSVKRVTLIALLVLLVLSFMFAIIIICNRYELGTGYDRDIIYYSMQNEGERK